MFTLPLNVKIPLILIGCKRFHVDLKDFLNVYSYTVFHFSAYLNNSASFFLENQAAKDS